jgi:hypothetical protein
MPTTLRLAVCLINDVTALDFQGPIEQFGFISPKALTDKRGLSIPDPKYAIEANYLAISMNPVQSSGPALVPTRTYESVAAGEQFDIILVPGGMYPRPIHWVATYPVTSYRIWYSAWRHSGRCHSVHQETESWCKIRPVCLHRF